MKTKVDIESWNRKEHFHFFKKFTEPFHGISLEVCCTKLYQKSKSENVSFFIMYMHSVLKAVNGIENFRLRIDDHEVYLYDKINVSPTIGRKDNTFSFSYIEYEEDFQKFLRNAINAMEEINNNSGIGLSLETSRIDVIHFSTLPWIRFTSLSHARMLNSNDSAPKITVGKLFQKGDDYFLPVSIHVHHALVDGYHVGQFINELDNEFNV